jgi:hypothetical protein
MKRFGMQGASKPRRDGSQLFGTTYTGQNSETNVRVVGDAKVGLAMPHGLVYKRRRDRIQIKMVTGCAAHSLLSVNVRYWCHLDLPIVTRLMYTTSSMLAFGQRLKRSHMKTRFRRIEHNQRAQKMVGEVGIDIMLIAVDMNLHSC